MAKSGRLKTSKKETARALTAKERSADAEIRTLRSIKPDAKGALSKKGEKKFQAVLKSAKFEKTMPVAKALAKRKKKK